MKTQTPADSRTAISGAGPGIYRDGTYLDNNQTWHVEDSAWKAKKISEILERNRIVFDTVVEIGCGAGEILNQLRMRYPKAEFCGFDVSPQANLLSSARQTERLTFYQKDLLTEDRNFDLTLCIDVFEHVEDYLGFLKALRSKGCRTIFHIPLDLSVQTILRVSPIRRSRESVGHLHYFTKESALATLAHCGFRVIDCFFTSDTLDLPRPNWRTKAMKLPRRLAYVLSPDFAARRVMTESS